MVDRVIRKRGAEHVFTELDPARTALIVIDMRNDHNAPPCAVYTTFGDIMPTDMVVELLSKARQRWGRQNQD